MLELLETHRQIIVELAEREQPLECCALLIGQTGSNTVVRVEPIDNELRSPTSYRLDSAQYVRAATIAAEEGLDIIGVLHSHPKSAAYPSATDIADADNPLIPLTWHWAIVSLAASHPELRSFQFHNGDVVEEPIRIWS